MDADAALITIPARTAAVVRLESDIQAFCPAEFNGFFLIGAAGSLGGAALGLVRSSGRSIPAPAPGRPEPEQERRGIGS